MVRTLDFQSKNVGSIPSGPNILLNYAILKKNKKINQNFFFDFFFVSLFAPNFLKNFTSFSKPSLVKKKIYLKQSYVLLTWFYYLTMINKNKKEMGFFVLPKKKYIGTHLKAPIAHKTWSKEQYMFQFYLIKISFKTETFLSIPNSVNAGFLAIFFSSTNFPIFETNLLFLKYFKFMLILQDKKYFSY